MAYTYTTLKTAISAWTHRADLSSVLDDFILHAESVLNRELRVSQQETRVTLTAAEYIAFPADFLAVRNIKSLTSPVISLQYVSPEQMDIVHQNASGNAYYYTIVEDKFRFYPVPTTDIEIDYYASIPALTGSNSSNWLLALFPDVYLYGCMAEAYKYTANDAQQAKFESMFFNGISRIKDFDSNRKYGQSLAMKSS